MTDNLTAEQRSENMRRIRSTGMKPETAVRRMLHQAGYRFRLHRKDLPGHPDIVFPAKKKVVFVHGCFWHQHQSSRCKIARIPKSNQRYWIPKLTKNQMRDKKNRRMLREIGWKSAVVWECQTVDIEAVRRRLAKFLED